MSFKNKLQEIYQKQQIDLPKYITELLPSQQHSPIWKSTIITCDGLTATSTANSKKQAELKCAEIILDNLSFKHHINKHYVNNKLINKFIYDLEVDIYIFIDIENRPKFLDKLFSQIEFISNTACMCYIYVVGTSHNPSYIKAYQTYSNIYDINKNDYSNIIDIEFVGIESMYKDAADIAMAVKVGEMLRLVSNGTKVYFISNDHFIGSLYDYYKNHLQIKPFTCPNFDIFIQQLKNS
jgi:hypothetical protein